MIRKIFTRALLTAVFCIPLCATAQASHDQPATPEYAESNDVVAAGIINMDAVTVSGPQPGPGLWRVTKGDHDLWILGSLSPLPTDITWNSESVLDLVSQSQEVLWRPSFTVGADVGFFGKLSLGYGMFRAQKNPDGAKLKDLLEPDLYARWVAAKARYLPRDRGIESKRPMIAAEELFSAAIKDAGLGRQPIIGAPIRAMIKTEGIKETRPKVTVQIADPAAAIKDIRSMSLNDSACLAATLDTIDELLPRMITNANAWATGNLEEISFKQLELRNNTCTDVFSNAEFSRKWGIPDIRTSLRAEWLKAAETALATNASSFAVLPLEDVVGPTGYAARLSAMGYVVDAP